MTIFVGVGAQKAGTTWLFQQLSRHPQICFPAGKEIHFWDRLTQADAETWLDLPRPTAAVTGDGRPVRSGEITPAYLALPRPAIEGMYRAAPQARLFACLRNPIDRAWSSAVMAMHRCDLAFEEASDAWFLDVVHSASSRSRGSCLQCLQRWWDVFPREQMLLLLYDDVSRDPRAVLMSLAEHLDVTTDEFAQMPEADVRVQVVPGTTGSPPRASSTSLPMPAAVESALHEMYDFDIAALGALIGRDLASWLLPRSAQTAGTASRRAVPVGGPGAATVRRISQTRTSE